MPYSDPIEQKEALRQWYLNVVVPRKENWFEKNGPCKKCGSSNSLELDHVDPSKKVSHNIWSWSDKKRALELAKCQVLCHNCHAKKTTDFHKQIDIWKSVRNVGEEGTAWCTGHQEFHSVSEFGSRADNWNGLREYCKRFRNEAGKLGKQM